MSFCTSTPVVDAVFDMAHGAVRTAYCVSIFHSVNLNIMLSSSSFMSSHDRCNADHMCYFVATNISVFVYHQLSDLLMWKGGQGTFNVHSDLLASCAREGEAGTDECTRALPGTK